MATKKQRRRREKEARHEYEFVYVDHEGNEVEGDEAAVHAPAPRKAPARAKAGKASAPARRTRGTPQPPSWRRVIKRGGIFAPIFFATVLLIGGKHVSFAQALVQSLLLLVLFVPFSYFLDTMVWRSHQKRLAGGSTAKR